MSDAAQLQDAIRNVERRQSGSGAKLVGRTLFNKQDYAAELQGQAGILIYERMRRDPEVSSALMRRKSPLLGASWTFEPPEQGDQKTIDTMMELCNRYILGEGRDSERDTWKGGLLPQILLMLDFGVSAVEKVWGTNEKGQQVYARLCPIGPQTINEFILDDLGNVAALKQFAYVMDPNGSSRFAYQLVPDPKEAPGATAEEKLAVFTYRREGDNLFGRPLLRELYQAWFHKYELWLLDGIQKERHGMGFTTVKIPTGVTDQSSPEYQAALEYVMQVRANERQGGVAGIDWEINHEFAKGTPPDIKGSQEYCDTQIARAMGVEESHLGNTPSGTRSMQEGKMGGLLMLAQADGDLIEQQVDSQLVEILCRMNVGPQPEYPHFRCQNLSKMTGTMKSEVLKNYADARLLRYDRKLEEHIREDNDLPKIDDATRESALPPQINTLGGAADAGSKSSPPANAAPPAGGAKKAAARPMNPTYPFRREPLPHEAGIDFTRIQGFLDQQPSQIWHRTVEPIRRLMVHRLASSAASSSDESLAKGQLAEASSLKNKMAAGLGEALLSVYAAGRHDVRQELRAAAKADPNQGDDEEIQPTKGEASWIRRLAEGFVAMQFLALTAEATRSALASRQADLSRADQERRALLDLNNLSVPVVQANLSGTVNRVYTTGRNDQAQAQKSDIVTAYYTAMMDDGTCNSCAALDGAEHDPFDEDYQTPNPNCDWPDRCRCVTIYVSREQAQPEAA